MAENSSNDKLIAVVRVRGRVNVRNDITETLNRLHLPRPNNCIVLKMSGSYNGMLNKCSNYVAYGEVEQPVLEKLLEKGGDIKASELMGKEFDMKKLKDHLPFRLKPPRRGYKNVKLSYKQGGTLGYMGADINKLLKRMV